jgi:hypothetical protein
MGERLGQQLRELVLQQPLRLAATNDSTPASAPTPILVFERSAFLLIAHGAPTAVGGERGGRGGEGARLTASAASAFLSPPAPPSFSGEVVARRRGRFPFPASAEEEQRQTDQSSTAERNMRVRATAERCSRKTRACSPAASHAPPRITPMARRSAPWREAAARGWRLRQHGRCVLVKFDQ